LKTNFSKFFKELLLEKGLNKLNEYFPYRYTDGYSELWKALLLYAISFSTIVMIAHPNGFLYATFVRPLFINILLIMRVDVPEYYFPTPESGMHYLTVFIYCICAFISFRYMEKWKIPPMQRIVINITIMFLSFYVPFEWVYITLSDIYHNIPVYGYPVILTYGHWRIDGTILSYFDFLINSIVGIDGFVTVCGIYVLNFVVNDLKEFNYDIEFKYDKISKLLFLGFALSMFLWVIIPVHSPDMYEWGTKYFPQTIYVEYGYYEDYGYEPPNEKDIFGIVDEIWIPNNMIKYHNHIAKLFSVCFMFYTFTPRRKVLN
jgi:hypothetical protein